MLVIAHTKDAAGSRAGGDVGGLPETELGRERGPRAGKDKGRRVSVIRA